MDQDIVKHCVREYLATCNGDLVKLYRYAFKLGVRDELINLIDLLNE